MIEIVQSDNLPFLQGCAAGAFHLIYVDPPFNTGVERTHTPIRAVRDEQGGDRTGFGGKRYRTQSGQRRSYGDAFDDYLAFLQVRLAEARRVLADDGSLFVHLDAREVHYVKVLLDSIFGRTSFMNEIIWAYDYGGRSKSRWPAKHDSILWYARDPERYTFNYDAIDRVPYMAPGLVGPEKAAQGKTPTDVWWHTIVPTNSRERTGYPTQKPVGLLERIVRVHSRTGDRLLDFFAGSGSFGEAAERHGRGCTLVDVNPAAIEIMQERFPGASVRNEDGPPVIRVKEQIHETA